MNYFTLALAALIALPLSAQHKTFVQQDVEDIINSNNKNILRQFYVSPDGRYLIGRRDKPVGGIAPFVLFDNAKLRGYDIVNASSILYFDPSSRYVILSSYNWEKNPHGYPQAVIVEMATGQVIPIESDEHVSASFSPSGKYVALPAQRTSFVEFYDMEKLKSIGKVPLGQEDSANTVVWAGDNKILIAMRDRIRVVEVPSLRIIKDYPVAGGIFELRVTSDKRFAVYSVQSFMQGQSLEAFYQIDLEKEKSEQIIKHRPRSFTFSSDGKTLYFTNDSSYTHKYNFDTRKAESLKWKGQVTDIVYFNENMAILSVYEDSDYYFVPKTGYKYPLKGNVMASAFAIWPSPYSPHIAYRTYKEELYIFNINTKKLVKTKHNALSAKLCYVPDGKSVMVMTSDYKKPVFVTLP